MSEATDSLLHSTPAECRAHLDEFWKYGERQGQKGWRIRFAWWPVRIWAVGKYAYRTKERAWLKPVLEVYVPIKGWIAYKQHQYAANGAEAEKETG